MVDKRPRRTEEQLFHYFTQPADGVVFVSHAQPDTVTPDELIQMSISRKGNRSPLLVRTSRIVKRGKGSGFRSRKSKREAASLRCHLRFPKTAD